MNYIMKYIIYYIFILSLLFSCNKINPQVNNECVSIIQNTSVVSSTSKSCTLKVKYNINSYYGLLDAHYFQFKNFETLSYYGINYTLNINEIERNIINEHGSPYSLMVLMNKSIIQPVASNYFPNFELSMINYYSQASNYEINFAACGNNIYCN